MKKLLLVFFVLIMAAAANAQNLQDVVYLTNGSIIRGTLIEQVPNVKIRATDGSVWVFKQEEIDKITSEPAESQQTHYDERQYDDLQFETTKGRWPRKSGGVAYRSLSKGMRLFADFSLNLQNSFYTCSSIGYSGSFGKQMLPHFYAGLGLSAQIYIDYWYYNFYNVDEPELYAQLPLFADLRYDVFTSKLSPFVAARVGYAVGLDEVNDFSGFYFNPCVGLRIKSISFSIGADLVKLNHPWYFEDLLFNFQFREKNVKWQSAIMIRVGYEWGGRM